MTTTFYFLRHAETKVDLTRPANTWNLSQKGSQQAQVLITDGRFANIDHIYCSTEPKTSQTIQPVAEYYDLTITYKAGLNELGSHLQPITSNEFLNTRRKIFNDLYYYGRDTENAMDALKRFKETIAAIDTNHINKTALIVSHGCILTLYFGDLLDILHGGVQLFQRWKKLKFCSVGVVANNIVIKDIVA